MPTGVNEVASNESSYLYCIVVSSPTHWAEKDKEILRRGALIDRCHNGLRTCIYRVPASEMSKLPSYEGESYLGDDDSGHSLYPLPDIDAYREEKFSAWERVSDSLTYPPEFKV